MTSRHGVKIWGHEQVLATFLSYGQVSGTRQAEPIQAIGNTVVEMTPDAEFSAKVLRVIAENKLRSNVGN